MTRVAGREVNLTQLQQELRAGGLSYSGIGTDGQSIFSYDAGGDPVALPPTAAPILAAHVPQPDPTLTQKLSDAATLLNSPAVRDTQPHRDSFARLIGFRPLPIPLAQDATPGDLRPL